MARARNIKPSFFKNELLAELEPADRLLFIGLWCLADREGRIEDRPKRIKMELFPCDTYDVDAGLHGLTGHGFITRYESSGVKVISVVNFKKHQTPHGTEKDSEFPDNNGDLTVTERDKNGYATGNKRKNNVNSNENTGDSPLTNSAITVNPPLEHVNPPFVNALNPDSLNPDSLNPDSKTPLASAVSPPIATDARAENPPDGDPLLASAGVVSRACKALGYGDAAADYRLKAALDAGLTPDEIIATAESLQGMGHRFCYVLGAAKGRRRDASNVQPLPAKPSNGNPSAPAKPVRVVGEFRRNPTWKNWEEWLGEGIGWQPTSVGPDGQVLVDRFGPSPDAKEAQA